MSDPFRWTDDLGPARLLHVHEPGIGLKAVVCIDNVAIGPAIGGVRMAPDVTAAEAFRLARAMTLKNAAAGLAHGGGKSVIIGDPRMKPERKEQMIRAFARAIASLTDYIPGPDMGTDERAMAWIKDEIGRAVGLPKAIGGIPLDEIGATGYGVAVAAEVAQDYCGIALKGARIAVQGFGAVGRHAARFLIEKGARLVAASDSTATIHDAGGLDLARLSALKMAGRGLAEAGDGRRGTADAIIDVECDIWIPAARPDVITAENVARLKTRLVLQGANIPITAEAEATLHRRGVISVPDFIANAGGVIAAAVEHRGGAEEDAFRAIAAKIKANTAAVLDQSRRSGETPRAAAIALAEARIRAAMQFGRFARPAG